MRSVPTLAEQFGTFFNLHVDHVRRYSSTLVSSGSIDDVVQRSFTTAWERFEDIPEGSEREWLFGVVRNHCRNSWRSQRRSDALVAAIEQARPQVTVEVAANNFDPVEISPLLQALRELSEQECEVMALTGWFEMTPTEIAAMLDEAPGTIRTRLSRARKSLRQRFTVLTEEGDVR